MATIKDVAAVSGISIKTVSRVLNGASTVRPGVRAKVEAAMHALDYRPALSARQLASGRSHIVALIVPASPYSYFTRMIVSAAAACAALGRHLMIEVVHPMVLDDAWVLRLSCDPDAIIVAPPYSDQLPMLMALERLGKPAVRIAGHGDGYGTVLEADSRAIAAAMTGHLLSCGHRRIAMIAPPRPEMAAERRVDGYRDALTQAGISIDEALIVRGDMLFDSGRAAFTQLMAQRVRPTAIFAANDLMALGAMTAALGTGFAVPKDVAIAGFDDSIEGQVCYPALTTVFQPIEAIARTAVAWAVGQPEAAVPMEHRLILRQSA